MENKTKLTILIALAVSLTIQVLYWIYVKTSELLYNVYSNVASSTYIIFSIIIIMSMITALLLLWGVMGKILQIYNRDYKKEVKMLLKMSFY